MSSKMKQQMREKIMKADTEAVTKLIPYKYKTEQRFKE